ncbi:hypothetical protein AKJ16_DCAP16173 [Drosera capensis]
MQHSSREQSVFAETSEGMYSHEEPTALAILNAEMRKSLNQSKSQNNDTADSYEFPDAEKRPNVNFDELLCNDDDGKRGRSNTVHDNELDHDAEVL